MKSWTASIAPSPASKKTARTNCSDDFYLQLEVRGRRYREKQPALLVHEANEPEMLVEAARGGVFGIDNDPYQASLPAYVETASQRVHQQQPADTTATIVLVHGKTAK
jgi:hypothetical protein